MGRIVGVVAIATIMALVARPLQAQYNHPPETGGRIYTLGMPPVWKGYAGGGMGWYDPGGQALLLVRGHAGVTRDLTSPVVGAAAFGGEVYGGFRGTRTVDGGARALFSIPSLRLSTGVDWNFPDGDVSPIVRVELATRRSGIFGRGSLLRLEWIPSQHQTLGVGISVPLWGRNIGRTRPQKAHVPIERPERKPRTPPPDRELDSVLATLRDEALWITRLTMPLLDRGGEEATTAYAADVLAVRKQVERAPLPTRQQKFHDDLDRAFTTAVSAETGPSIADAARRILLDDVLLPYNRLLGQRKDPDELAGFIASANATFVSWLLREGNVVVDTRLSRATYLFHGLMEIAEAVRALQRERWEDSRFVWLPLQLALREEQYDTQAELNALIARATQMSFTRGNRVTYVMNEAFQLEFARSVLAAQDYHVLWIHDFRGRNSAGQPDRIGFAQVLVYLEALTRRVREYDRTGRLPQYFIFLDQNYFEINDTRLWFRLLHEPLDAPAPNLPAGFESWEREFKAAQTALRDAVAASRVLQAEWQQYGNRWLRNRIRVQINITNPADNSFTNNHIAGILPAPDNVSRDHRKIAFYDITETDPWRGRAMYTGMGIGEHYAGRNWEDRAVILQGPVALGVKAAARALLEQEGFRAEEMPFPFRVQPVAPDTSAAADTLIARFEKVLPGEQGVALELHNQTGFAPKLVDVERAILYTLMPSGSSLNIGDSLWQSYVYASMLVGSALRGCRVLVIAPSLRSAPSAAGPTMARAHGLLSALLMWRKALDTPISAHGGMLRVGLYAPRVGVGNLAGRIRQAWSGRRPWMDSLLPTNPAVVPVVDSIARALETRPGETYLVEADSLDAPKLHLKVNLLLSSPAFEAFVQRPEWANVVREYLAYLARKTGPIEGRPPAEQAPSRLVEALQTALLEARPYIPPEAWRQSIAYLLVGSTNMDYRSMVLDGEVQVTVTGWTTLFGVLDYVQLVGLSEWPETQEELDRLLPPPSGATRSIANLIRLLL